MKFVNVLLALSLTFGFSAMAQTKKATKSGTPPPAATADGDVPWGMGGCGIWNWVIKDKEQGPQIAVWALNNFVFGFQTSAITSGTSNCVDYGTKMSSNDQEVFVTVNLASLQKEAAQGKGEHLDTLAAIFGCQDKEGFAQLSQSRYEAIFANEKPETVLENYKSEIKSSKAVCGNAG